MLHVPIHSFKNFYKSNIVGILNFAIVARTWHCDGCNDVGANGGVQIAPATVTEGLPRQAIPRIVWQTHHTNKIPVTSRYLFELRRNNPEYTFHFVGDAEADAYMLNFSMKRVSQAYFSINPACGAARADIWRYAVLYDHGGIYLDVDSTCTKFSDIIRPNDAAVLSWAGRWHRTFHLLDREIDQWVMMYTPRHPFLKRALLLSAARVLNTEYLNRSIENIHDHVLVTTGPWMYREAIAHVLQSDPTTPHRVVLEDYEGNCTYKVLGWRSRDLDVHGNAGNKHKNYKDMRYQVFARLGFWSRNSTESSDHVAGVQRKSWNARKGRQNWFKKKGLATQRARQFQS
eukprot:m.1116404 g.1116404  ORF g.1116404 m.1116404 type:complete len:344 (+) comp24375_c0_seq21:2032-3063(+)